MNTLKLTALATAFGVAAIGAAAPASAVVVTFATFSDPTTASNFRLANSGSSASLSRMTDAVLYSTSSATATGPGVALVRFSFTQPFLSDFVTNVTAAFTYNATIARGTPAVAAFGGIVQQGITGSFSFLTTTAITVTGPHFVTHTYQAGSNLLSGTFTNATLFGQGSSAGTSSSTAGGSVVTFTSDFLNFTPTVERDRGLTLTAINPSLSAHTGLNKALNSFRATAGGQFSSDPAPLINGLAIVPEPGVWMLMVAGFGLVGVSARRRGRAVAA
jgi:hypothetical protein